MSHLAIETIEHVRILRLDRPERKNALTSSLGWSIVRAIGDANCSGLDLGGGDGELADTGLSDQQQVLDEKGWVGRFLLALRFETDKRNALAGLDSEDGQEAVRAIMEKRTPEFRGR